MLASSFPIAASRRVSRESTGAEPRTMCGSALIFCITSTPLLYSPHLTSVVSKSPIIWPDQVIWRNSFHKANNERNVLVTLKSRNCVWANFWIFLCTRLIFLKFINVAYSDTIRICHWCVAGTALLHKKTN